MSRAVFRGMKGRWIWVVSVGVAATVVLFAWAGAHAERQLTGPASAGVSDARATTGREQPDAIDADLSPSTIREIETITGVVDGHELIGRRVDLRLKAVGVTSAGAFWVGPGDNRILVTPVRTTRERRPVREGEAVTIVGTLQEIPNAKERLSWGLTAPDLLRLTDEKVYIRADRITP
jgi:hypothetical protein